MAERLLAAALIALPAAAAGPRADLEIPPHQVFQAMLAYADEGHFDRVAKILDRSGGLIAELEGFSGEALAKPLRAAVSAQNAWDVQSGILRLAYQHMRLEFSRASRGGGAGFSRSLRLGYLYFLFLKPRLASRAPRNAAEAEALFRALDEGRASGPDGNASLKFERIAALCQTAFPKGVR